METDEKQRLLDIGSIPVANIKFEDEQAEEKSIDEIQLEMSDEISMCISTQAKMTETSSRAAGIKNETTSTATQTITRSNMKFLTGGSLKACGRGTIVTKGY